MSKKDKRAGAAGAAGAGKKGAGKKGAGKQGAQKARKLKSAIGSTRVKDRSRLSERMRSATRKRLFVQALIPDALLVLLVSVAMAYTVSFAYESAPDLRTNWILIAALNLPLLAAMYWGTWSKRMLVPSIVATAVVAVVIVGAFMAASPEGGQMIAPGDPDKPYQAAGINDVPENLGVFAMVVVACAVVTFLLSRRTVGLVFLLVACVVACGAVQFLWRDWMFAQPGLAATIAALFGIGMLFVYQCYRQSVYSANRVKRTSFAGAFGFSALVGLACLLVGVGVYYGVVAGMDLTTPVIKPFTQEANPPQNPFSADYMQQPQEGDETSSETNDQEDPDGDEADDGNQGHSNDALGFLENTLVADFVKSIMNYDPDNENEDAGAQLPLILKVTAVVSAVLLVLAAVAVVVLWRLRRRFRLARIAKRSRRYQAWYLYTFLVRRFRRLKIRKPPSLTPMEFALGFARPMNTFTRGTGGVDFVRVTEVYEDAVYGAKEPTDEQLEELRRYYRAFFKNARIRVGWPKWVLWKFWRI